MSTYGSHANSRGVLVHLEIKASKEHGQNDHRFKQRKLVSCIGTDEWERGWVGSVSATQGDTHYFVVLEACTLLVLWQYFQIS